MSPSNEYIIVRKACIPVICVSTKHWQGHDERFQLFNQCRMVDAFTTACARFITPAPEIQWYLANDSRNEQDCSLQISKYPSFRTSRARSRQQRISQDLGCPSRYPAVLSS